MARQSKPDTQLDMGFPESPRPGTTSKPAPVSTHPWVAPRYTKTRVDKAGRALVRGTATEADLDVINNWRSSHSFPLNSFQVTLRGKALHLDDTSVVAQRLKRLSSIDKKLSNSTMKLSQMQDIGGCRAVVSDVRRVRLLRDKYLTSDIRHDLVDEDDYIQNPRKSGYRSIHLIYRYRSDRKATYNGLQIEMQFRSRLQHAWATAVETVDTFTGQALKSSEGDAPWLRFFALMGSAIAIREKSPMVDGTPSSEEELRRELRDTTRELNVQARLDSFHTLVELASYAPPSKKTNYFLIELQPGIGKTSVTPFALRDVELATEEYLKVEKALTQPGAQAVLVSVESLDALKRAYPNYFLDTRRFIEAVMTDLPPGNWTDLSVSPLLTVEDGCGRASSPRSRSSRC